MSIFQALFASRTRRAAPPLWLGVYAGTERVVAALAAPPATPGGRPRMRLAPAFEPDNASTELAAWCGAGKPLLNLMLPSRDYRILPIDAPAVAPEEWRAAVRWQVKDMLDFPADEACVDCLKIPGPTPGVDSKRLFVVAASRQTVRASIESYRAPGLMPSRVDIPEMALRNLSVLAAGDGAHAFIHVGLRSTRLALVWQRELCSFRQFEMAAPALALADEDDITAMLDRLALEIQRTTDAFSRQFHGADLAQVWVSSVSDTPALAQRLAQLLPQRVQAFVLQEHVDIEGRIEPADMAAGVDHLLAIGAALRTESA